MKIIANHFLDPRITIAPHSGSDKSWIWVAFDFAEYEIVEKVLLSLFIILYAYAIIMCLIRRHLP